MPKKKIPDHAGLVPLLTAEQVVSHLNISLRTLYRLVDSRKLTCYKLDGLLRFNPADLRSFLTKRAIRAGVPEPFEEVPADGSESETGIHVPTLLKVSLESEYRAMTDQEAREFFEGLKKDENGCYIAISDNDE